MISFLSLLYIKTYFKKLSWNVVFASIYIKINLHFSISFRKFTIKKDIGETHLYRTDDEDTKSDDISHDGNNSNNDNSNDATTANSLEPAADVADSVNSGAEADFDGAHQSKEEDSEHTTIRQEEEGKKEEEKEEEDEGKEEEETERGNISLRRIDAQETSEDPELLDALRELKTKKSYLKKRFF